MLIKNDRQNYGLFAIILHWLIAIVCFGLFALGLWMTDLGYYDSWYQKAPEWHEGIGALLFIILLVRILWRGINITPDFPGHHKKWQKIASFLVHGLLDILLLVIMISGYLIVTAKGEALIVFDYLSVPASLSGISNQADLAGEIHLLAAWMLIVLAIVHALAALKHHYFDKDRTLKRMLGL